MNDYPLAKAESAGGESEQPGEVISAPPAKRKAIQEQPPPKRIKIYINEEVTPEPKSSCFEASLKKRTPSPPPYKKETSNPKKKEAGGDANPAETEFPPEKKLGEVTILDAERKPWPRGDQSPKTKKRKRSPSHIPSQKRVKTPSGSKSRSRSRPRESRPRAREPRSMSHTPERQAEQSRSNTPTQRKITYPDWFDAVDFQGVRGKEEKLLRIEEYYSKPHRRYRPVPRPSNFQPLSQEQIDGLPTSEANAHFQVLEDAKMRRRMRRVENSKDVNIEQILARINKLPTLNKKNQILAQSGN